MEKRIINDTCVFSRSSFTVKKESNAKTNPQATVNELDELVHAPDQTAG